jgi:hypothetical protein
LEKKTWGKPVEGLLITSGVTLLIANLADLSSMSTIGSSGFLIIFAAVNGANVVLADQTQSRRTLSLVGVGLCLGALGSLIWQTANRSPEQLWLLFAFLGAAILIEFIFRVVTGRRTTLSGGKNKI